MEDEQFPLWLCKIGMTYSSNSEIIAETCSKISCMIIFIEGYDNCMQIKAYQSSVHIILLSKKHVKVTLHVIESYVKRIPPFRAKYVKDGI
jgi:hypothetical protein